MEKNKINDLVTKCASNLRSNQNGYFPVAGLGIELSKHNFDYTKLGHKKLIDFLKSVEIIEISYDEAPSKHPYAKLKINMSEIVINDSILPVVRPRNIDFDGWGILFGATVKLSKLKELALPEKWSFSADDEEFPILQNYLLFTYKKLVKEGGKIVSSKDYSVFNTGLVDKRYDPIYAIFSKNENYSRDSTKYHEWVFSAFSTETDRYWGLILGNNFNPLPGRANYFTSSEQMYYDVSQGVPSLSDNHIIIDNIERFPVEFIEQHIGTTFDIRFIFGLSGLDREKEIKGIQAYLESNDKIVISMRNRLKDAIEIAVKRVSWNFKTAIPLYFVRENKMSLLFPLAIMDDTIVDIALVVMKLNAGGYRGMTIFTLEQAYKSARLVSRPDSDWLAVDSIDSSVIQNEDLSLA